MVRAVVCRELGSPEHLRLEDVPPAPLGPGQVRVAVHAVGINFPDILMVAGGYQLKPALPFTPGFEAAGVISELAPGVNGLAVGDRVITRHRFGSYADEVVVEQAKALPMPAGFSFVEGACFAVAYGTAYHALVQRGRLQPGQTLLVHGAGGGVGLAAVEIGKILHATVIATGSNPDKLAVVRLRGADHVIDYSKEDFVPRVRELTGNQGADVIYDPVGGDVFGRSLSCIAWGGRLLVVGFAAGSLPSAAANRILLKGCAVVGVRAGEFARRDPETGRRNISEVLGLAARGLLRPHISHVLPLEEFATGMQLLSDRKAIGRVVLTTGRTT